MLDTVPLIFSQEQAQINEELNGKDLLVIFDGTTRFGEVMAIVVRFISSDWQTQQRLIHFQLIVQSMSGEQVARELITALSIQYSISSSSLLAAMLVVSGATVSTVRDQAMSANRKRSYDAAFKLAAVEDAEKTTNRVAARKLRVDERRIREWRQKKSDLVKIPSKKKRLEGGGRKASLPEMEEVVAWIEGCRAKNFRVTRVSVRRKVAEITQAQGKA